MPGSFGEIALSIHSYLDGCILSYGMSNVVVTNEISDFKNLYDTMLADYIESQSFVSKKFLDVCVSNYENIINHNFSFLTSEYKVKNNG